MEVDELLRLLLGEALAANGSCDIRRHEYEALARVPRAESASAECAAVGDSLQQSLCRGIALVLYIQLAVGNEHADRALVRAEALIHMERLPRAHLFVLRDAVDELARGADGVHVHLTGIPVTEVAQAQRECAPYSDVDFVVASGTKP